MLHAFNLVIDFTINIFLLLCYLQLFTEQELLSEFDTILHAIDNLFFI